MSIVRLNLELKGIETRPIMSGNFTEQPVSKLLQWEKHGELKNSKLIMRNSFFIGNHLQILEYFLSQRL